MKDIIDNINKVTKNVSENKIIYLILSFCMTLIGNEVYTIINKGYNNFYGLNSVIKLKSSNIIYMFLFVLIIIFLMKFIGFWYLKLIKLNDRKSNIIILSLIWFYFIIMILLLSIIIISNPKYINYNLFKNRLFLLLIIYLIISSIDFGKYQKINHRVIYFLFLLSIFISYGLGFITIIIEFAFLWLLLCLNLEQFLEFFPAINDKIKNNSTDRTTIFLGPNSIVMVFLGFSVYIFFMKQQLINLGEYFAKETKCYLTTRIDKKDYLIIPLEANKGVFIDIISSDETGIKINRSSFKILSVENIDLSYENKKVYPENK